MSLAISGLTTRQRDIILGALKHAQADAAQPRVFPPEIGKVGLNISGTAELVSWGELEELVTAIEAGAA